MQEKGMESWKSCSADLLSCEMKYFTASLKRLRTCLYKRNPFLQAWFLRRIHSYVHRFSSYLDLPTHYSTLTALLSVFAGEDSPKEHVMEAGPWTTWDLTKIPILGRYRGLQPKSWGKDSIASISFVIGTPGRWLQRKPFLNEEREWKRRDQCNRYRGERNCLHSVRQKKAEKTNRKSTMQAYN